MRRLALLCVALAGAGAHAQTVYRCGPEGRLYSQTPCAQGRAIEVGDERSAEQRAVAVARLQGDQALGATLERERLAREVGTATAAARIDGRPAPAEAAAPPAAGSKKKKRKGSQAEGDDFKAVAPATKAARPTL